MRHYLNPGYIPKDALKNAKISSLMRGLALEKSSHGSFNMARSFVTTGVAIGGVTTICWLNLHGDS